jgi:hypothetical protein
MIEVDKKLIMKKRIAVNGLTVELDEYIEIRVVCLQKVQLNCPCT